MGDLWRGPETVDPLVPALPLGTAVCLVPMLGQGRALSGCLGLETDPPE